MDKLLPYELIVNILLCLSIKDVLRFRCVSKSWRALISDQYFMEKHIEGIETNVSIIINKYHGGSYKLDLNHILDEKYDNAIKLDDCPFNFQTKFNCVVGSRNGLVCLSNGFSCVSIWNPSRPRKIHKLPPMPIKLGGYSTYAYGFGNDNITDDYKVVGIAKNYRREGIPPLGIEARVYSMKNKSWAKQSHYIPDELLHVLGSGIFASSSNALYWIMKYDVKDDSIIGGFDLGDDDNGCHEVQIPEFEYNRPQTLGVLRGCLCIFSTNSRAKSRNLWVMKEESIWTKLISFPIQPNRTIMPLAYSRTSDKVLLKDWRQGEDFKSKLIWYDLKTKTVVTVIKLHEDLLLQVGDMFLHQEIQNNRNKEGRHNFFSSLCKIFRHIKCISS